MDSPTLSSSFPKDYSYTTFDSDDNRPESPLPLATDKPRILVMGLRRSGKSSILKVVFQKVSPNETLFLESTNKIVKTDIDNNSFVQFQYWDFPGQVDFYDPTFDTEIVFARCDALVFVLDAHDDYTEALAKLNQIVSKAYQVNKDIQFEVFIHKVDGINEDLKTETQRDIHQRATDDLGDAGFDNIVLSFHLTSIYDYSIFEAFSKVVQKLIPQLPKLENLLNLFIVVSACYFCCNFGISSASGFWWLLFYQHPKWKRLKGYITVNCRLITAQHTSMRSKQKLFIYKRFFLNFILFIQNSGIEKTFLFDIASKTYMATDSAPVDMQSFELCCDMIDVVMDLSIIYRYINDEQSRQFALCHLNEFCLLFLFVTQSGECYMY